MSEERIKELQDFAEEFQEQLKGAKEIYQQRQSKSKTIEPKYTKTENAKLKLPLKKSFDGKKKINKLKKIDRIKLNNQHWVPNCLFGKSFEKFKKLSYPHYPTSWELVHKNNKLNIYIYIIFIIGKNSFNKKII